MPIRNPIQFSFTGLLLVFTASGLVCGMGIAGGPPWFVFGATLLGGFVALWFGFRWAIYGSGYWPHGRTGRLLLAAMLVVIPAAIILLVRLTGVGIEKQPGWYRPVGVRPASVPAVRFAAEPTSRLSPLRPVG